MDALALVQDSGLLTAGDLARLQALAPAIRQSFATAQVFRTETEARLSVLNDAKHPTPDSKYWQAVREQDVFATELGHLSYEYRRVQLEIRKLERRLAAEDDELERESLLLEIEHQGFVLALLERTAHHRVREIEQWQTIKEELTPLLAFGASDPNPHQHEAMRLRWGREAALVNAHTPPADARNILGLARAAGGI
jgi:hypothetical protein